ncbi:hypothetical protein B0J13DRAFT_582833 [Dactylonectria estremocensis]|uniref:DUF6546 domain-containing protein n=1 Tax=Dactylonectria estremocensis TaxID=1079267 RepID=A0A9P9F2T5_9HYPO|nr:hypothetical protein B0J13DRAFT_582833 [Dactylonectria estremocensis]
MEIRLMTLETITSQMLPGWASFASVCKEWQLVNERSNFRRLWLELSSLNDFSLHVIRQRKLVRYILFEIELPRYTCETCGDIGQFRERTVRDSPIIWQGIRDLFSILSTWAKTGDLVLELEVYSPSDSEHWFKHDYFAYEDEDNEDVTSMHEVGSGWHHSRHGWVNGRQVKHPLLAALPSLFEMVSLVAEKPATVCAVTGLVIRRNLRRCLIPVALQRILDGLCRLEHFVFEPWRAWHPQIGALLDEHLIQSHLPKTLKTVSIFEDFDELIHANNIQQPNVMDAIFEDMADYRVADRMVGEAFVSRSLDLEELSVSYTVDAAHFFEACTPALTWQNLRSLALTSHHLHVRSQRRIRYLLRNSGTAALQMPSPRLLVIWSGFKGSACAFNYQVDRECASMTWWSTWDLAVTSDTMEEAIISHGDAIHHLNLPCKVVTPISLRQMRKRAYQRII